MYIEELREALADWACMEPVIRGRPILTAEIVLPRHGSGFTLVAHFSEVKASMAMADAVQRWVAEVNTRAAEDRLLAEGVPDFEIPGPTPNVAYCHCDDIHQLRMILAGDMEGVWVLEDELQSVA
jgi:hypothetical protein